ncbi:AAA family ATPase [Streptomyces sp. SAJ15]|uniref:AAA family ATPase n=1 Tax=Streptomyces sp. SAJ15 TaxID=2011095 RepID=UPI0011850845|nr:SMC family ATPase [Streptomyces sp. SAJ15]TVL89677.1 ATP-binding cassette family protein [Streptomyces sp. SAJ15]
MRLHRMSVTAFGPFGGTQEVDFDELAAAGLFLLHGPTGAGKTSVLDAVCFGLYGGVPGARQGAGLTLRSDHADPHTLTEVVLELTVGGRRLEITRRPQQTRPKRSRKSTKGADGFTTQRAHSELRERSADGEWVGLSRSHQEIGLEIEQLLGMNREQFCQVVLLPQGDFARFLRADAEARGKLLGRLFDTGRFAAVEDHLAEARRTAQQRVVGGDERLLALAHRMAQAAGDSADLRGLALLDAGGAPPAVPGQRTGSRARSRAERPTARAARAASGAERTAPAPGEPGFAAAVLEWAAIARSGARERADIAAAAVRTAEAAHDRAAAALESVRELDRLQRRHADARRRAAELDARRADVDQARARLERARAAESVAPALELHAGAEREHQAAAAAERAARDLLPPRLADAPAEQLTTMERQLREELGRLAVARRAERRAAEIAVEAAELDREARADEEAAQEAADWLAGWEPARLAHQRRVEVAQAAAVQAERLGAQLGPAERQLAAALRRDALEAEVDAAEDGSLRARREAATARERWLDLKERRLRGIAAELAGGLLPGEPCAVCGSADHPRPARAAEGHVDRAAEEAALADSERADAARKAAEERLRELREAMAAARAEAADTPTVELAHALEELRAAFATAREAGADAHAAREALDHAEAEHGRRLEQLRDAERDAASRASRRDVLARERADLEEQVAQARGAAASVADHARELERRVALLAGAADAARATESAALRLKDSDARLADAAYRAGFDTPRGAADAVLPDHRQRALQDHLDRWHSESAAVAAELDDPQLTAAAQAPPAALAAAQAALEDATLRLRAASAADDAARTRRADLDRLSEQAATDARRLAPLRAEYDRVARLAALAAGTSADNERKMRLESYVLAARLEQVAAAASARLQHMSSGRYTLVHSDERTGTRRAGLGLHVIDSWTGRERDTATLSGGETFFASLALALGLADVVTDEAGGTRLDTLFIDEGFGSLDEQTLDEVLDVLDSLRERDRAVGIVSHVADLRRRIPAQLEVVKDRAGSAVRRKLVLG